MSNKHMINLFICIIVLANSNSVLATNLNDAEATNGSWFMLCLAFLLPIIIGFIIDIKNNKVECLESKNNINDGNLAYSQYQKKYVDETFARLIGLLFLNNEGKNFNQICEEILNGKNKIPVSTEQLYEKYFKDNCCNYETFYKNLCAQKKISHLMHLANNLQEVVKDKMSYQDVIGRIENMIEYIENNIRK